MSGPYIGPCLIATVDEAARILDALRDHSDETAALIRRKCVAVLEAEPQWRKPLK